MKTIGIIGGLSPASSIKYYEWLNRGVNARLGGHHNAKILMSSVDFGTFVELKEAGDWQTQGELIVAEAVRLDKAGADFIILATNTMHMFAPEIEAAISIPFVHLADATGAQIRQKGLSKIGLLGTRFTMEGEFYKTRLALAGIETIVPDAEGIETVNSIIYDELCHDIVTAPSRTAYGHVIASLIERGAEGIIMGCTEITLLIDQSDSAVPLFDTTRIHVDAALEAVFG